MDVEDLIGFLLQDRDIQLSRAYEKSEVRWLQPDAQITFARSSSQSTYKKSETYSAFNSENWDDLIEDLDNLILTPLRSSNIENNDRNNLIKTKSSGRKNKEVKEDRYQNRKTRHLEEKTSHDKLRRPKLVGKHTLGAANMETERKSSIAQCRSKDDQYKIPKHELRRKNGQIGILKHHETENGPPSKSNEKSRKTKRKERRNRVENIHPEICAEELRTINPVRTITKYTIINQQAPSTDISSECNEKLDEKITSKKRTKKKRHPVKGTLNNTNSIGKMQAKIQPHKDDIQ